MMAYYFKIYLTSRLEIQQWQCDYYLKIFLPIPCLALVRHSTHVLFTVHKYIAQHKFEITSFLEISILFFFLLQCIQ